jgi:hypothetical protein
VKAVADRRAGVALGARFSLPTAERGLCGPPTAARAFRSVLRDGTLVGDAALALRRFEALYPYLETIGEAWGLDPLDEEVIEAYWIGNGLLDRGWRGAFPLLLERLSREGLPVPLAARLRRHLPSGAIPHHTFHVLFVGVGAVTGRVPTTLANMERCRVSWGTVRAVEDDLLRIEGPRLLPGPRLGLGGRRQSAVTWEAEVLPGVRPGDAVAAHWGQATARLSPEQQAQLERWTRHAIAAVNEARASRTREDWSPSIPGREAPRLREDAPAAG